MKKEVLMLTADWLQTKETPMRCNAYEYCNERTGTQPGTFKWCCENGGKMMGDADWCMEYCPNQCHCNEFAWQGDHERAENFLGTVLNLMVRGNNPDCLIGSTNLEDLTTDYLEQAKSFCKELIEAESFDNYYQELDYAIDDLAVKAPFAIGTYYK